MKVLLTGAGGFLGRALGPALVRHGHSVRALMRSRSDLAVSPLAPGIEPWWGDLRTTDLDAALAGVDAVVHLAAVFAGDVMEQFLGTVVPTEALLQAMVRSGTTRLVLVSSFSVYDWRAPARALTEESPLEDHLERRDGYCITKTWQERVCRRFAGAHGWQLTVIRPGFIWSDERPWVEGVGIRLGSTVLVNGPFRRLPLTHVASCADCVARSVACEAANGETFNAVDSDDVRAWSHAGELIRDGVANVRRRIALPYAFGLWAAFLASGLARWLLGPENRLPGILIPARYRARFRSLRFPNGKAVRVLGWKPGVYGEPVRGAR
jgi:nucleoside-diphosphate-sugar epimerase